MGKTIKNTFSNGNQSFLVPIKKANEKEIVAFFEVLKQGDKPVQVKFHQKHYYKKLSFDNNKISPVSDAERLVYKYMLVNEAVFGYKDFLVPDPRLFSFEGKRDLGRSIKLTSPPTERICVKCIGFVLSIT